MRRGVIKQRVITALIALPLLILFVFYASRGLFAGLVLVVNTLALYEFYRMALSKGRRMESSLAVASGAVCCAFLIYTTGTPFVLLSLVLPSLFLALVYLFRFQDMQIVGRDLAVSVLGLMYVPLLLSHVVFLRALPAGQSWVLLVMFVVMASDTMAYFVGRRWGQRRLYEAVSPNKSVEGALGGLAGGVIGAVISKVCFFSGLGFADILLVGVGVGAFSQLGDLFESLLKRSFGVKDSGTLIPGHGGILDRLDSLLFAFPVTYYYAAWMFA